MRLRARELEPVSSRVRALYVFATCWYWPLHVRPGLSTRERNRMVHRTRSPARGDGGWSPLCLKVCCVLSLNIRLQSQREPRRNVSRASELIYPMCGRHVQVQSASFSPGHYGVTTAY
ncbi:hypothetical protein CSUI_006544 [Cystoisospora suis]|uniref:Uncharacterized protein n=1 Tax=Cystoisospora suis TaxID=483139 RepID=A0A2C6KTK8_9APIC|nr:hypothetical protein CSUI_006544 [Cystoisospora suis]